MSSHPQPPAARRSGVLAAGHWIVDHIRLVEAWPDQDTIALISGEASGNGGGAYNLLTDLARSECGFPLFAAGLLGDDADGVAVLKDCEAHHIDTTNLRTTKQAPTSYAYVITATDTGRRTFFHQPGANQFLTAGQVDLSACPARIFYLGYPGMLDGLDRLDEDGRNGASRLLERAMGLGMKTVADLCSNVRQDMASIIIPSLPFLDYLFLNEFEAGQLAEMSQGTVSRFDAKSLISLGEEILARGVKEAVIVHVPNGAVCVQRERSSFVQGSVRVPESLIRGTAGAGDAFAAGFILGVHEGWSSKECLQLAVSMAAASLQDPSCSASVPSWKTSLAWSTSLGFREFN
jgi:sugar/nucleoside kinase (ribokinase family)